MNTSKQVVIIVVCLVVVFALSYFFIPKPTNAPVTNPASNNNQNQEPVELNTKYIHPVDWPPQIQITSEPFTCTEAGSPIERAGQTKKEIINGREYCVTQVVEGAAGSTYTQYAYAADANGKEVILTFTLQAVQCANYDEPQKTECANERTSFDIGQIVDKIFQTIKNG